MSLQPKPYITPEEYLALERQAEVKSEYFGGEMFLMAGATEAHNLVVANLVGEFRNQFKNRPCKVYPADMRVKIPMTGLYTYPDVTAICGEPEFEDDHRDTLLNPTVIIEVLSDSTEAYDRGKKFEHYRGIISLSDYLLVAQDRPEVEHFSRQQNDIWLFHANAGIHAVVEITSVQCRLELAEIYDKVQFLAP
jgi:Uma2 family endonuclease